MAGDFCSSSFQMKDSSSIITTPKCDETSGGNYCIHDTCFNYCFVVQVVQNPFQLLPPKTLKCAL